MLKKELREKYKQKRKALSAEEIDEKSLTIANKLLELPIWDYTYYHIFLSIEKQQEVNTEFLLHILSGKDKNIVVSKSDFKIHQMTNILLTDNTNLKVNKWGIPEPTEGIEIMPKKIQVVFVPLLAFDINGHRTGYGKGFYDRFLDTCAPNTLKIGLSFFFAEAKIEDTNPHDKKLDYCVTPNEIYKFS
ncbi:5-formyltetrahydrofolate cyclo-ligase [Haloflavibacter putidus]|uniref:5-formyltetrahydrofolate cyclo-ligase n=1 Tax=Haloflavibacter putidus TaxID=2576776 RepID=A0A507ZI87_9FLAO|nr:5-formyltetrahydrofolate cyclo-ligase [Haloflavibacter putidus]TQD36919.1 5-formyltetrahydrofolate cyclo-ligase [Haloflavibacter putidus]